MISSWKTYSPGLSLSVLTTCFTRSLYSTCLSSLAQEQVASVLDLARILIPRIFPSFFVTMCGFSVNSGASEDAQTRRKAGLREGGGGAEEEEEEEGAGADLRR